MNNKGYIIINHFDISGQGDYELIKRERKSVGAGEHVFHPENLLEYTNELYPEPPIFNYDPCDEDTEAPQCDPIPYGSQRVVIDDERKLGYVEFYYKEVVG